MAQHFGENKSIARARELGMWPNMEAECIDYIKKCHTCQIQKLQRIKHKAEAIVPDTLTNLNDKIVLDTLGRLPVTAQQNEYINPGYADQIFNTNSTKKYNLRIYHTGAFRSSHLHFSITKTHSNSPRIEFCIRTHTKF